MCDSLLKYLLGPLSVPPYQALGVRDTEKGDKMGFFCSPECLDQRNLLVKIPVFPVLILSAQVIELLNCLGRKALIRNRKV